MWCASCCRIKTIGTITFSVCLYLKANKWSAAASVSVRFGTLTILWTFYDLVLEQILIYLLVPLCFKMSTSGHVTCSRWKNQIRKSAGGVAGRWGVGLLSQRKSVFKKRRCFWESWNHLINQERETELSPAGVQSKPEQLWVLRGEPNPLVAPPGAWKPGGESPFVRTKATLTRFHCDKKWEGCFVGAEKQPTRGANKMPIHLTSFTLIPRPSPFLSFVCSTTKQQTVEGSENTRI